MSAVKVAIDTHVCMQLVVVYLKSGDIKISQIIIINFHFDIIIIIVTVSCILLLTV